MSEQGFDKFAGLNLPDLMERMHGVVYPDAISMFPATIGWKLVGLWVLACLLLITIHQVRRYRANRYRREAIRLVSQVKPTEESAAQHIASLVKRTAIAAFPRSQVASLTGSQWQAFLLESSSEKLESREALLLSSAAYNPGVDTVQVQQAAIRWIRFHHA